MEYAEPPIDCGAPEIQEMMGEAYMMTLQKQGLAYNVFRDGRVVGQFMLRMYSIEDKDYETTLGQHEFSCIKIEYIGVDKKMQKQGIGTETLLGILKRCLEYINKLPIRFIFIESVQNLERWYSEYAFSRLTDSMTIRNPNNAEYTIPMCIDCMDHDAVDKYSNWLVG